MKDIGSTDVMGEIKLIQDGENWESRKGKNSQQPVKNARMRQKEENME